MARRSVMKSIAISPTAASFAPLLFAGKPEEALPLLKGLGFDAVELSLANPKDLDFEGILLQLRKENLSVSTIATGQSFYNEGISLSNPDPKVREEGVRRVKASIDLCSRIDAKVIIGGIRGKTGNRPPTGEEMKGLLDIIADCARYAKSRGVMLLLEPINRYETNIINNIKQAMDFIAHTGSDNLRILADLFHMNIEEASIEDSLWGAREYLGGLHVADSNRFAPGWGHIDFGKVRNVLRKMGFRGFVCAEILPTPNDESAARQAIEFLRDFP